MIIKQSDKFCRNPFYLRSSFLPRNMRDSEIFKRCRNPFYLRSSFLLSDSRAGNVFLHRSQSLLFEVFFSTHKACYKPRILLSQSLLFEVFFSTDQDQSKEFWKCHSSQSLLFEVFFSTQMNGGGCMRLYLIGRNPFYLRSSFLQIDYAELPEIILRRNPFYLRSSFLRNIFLHMS